LISLRFKENCCSAAVKINKSRQPSSSKDN
jgi:hypothetical protein